MTTMLERIISIFLIYFDSYSRCLFAIAQRIADFEDYHVILSCPVFVHMLSNTVFRNKVSDDASLIAEESSAMNDVCVRSMTNTHFMPRHNKAGICAENFKLL